MVFKTFDEQNRLIIETLPKQFTNICKDTIFFLIIFILALNATAIKFSVSRSENR